MATPESVSLTLSNQHHNKSYSVSLIEQGGGWIVQYSYGSVGAPQRMGLKTPQPVSYAEAVRVYRKVVAEQTEKPCRCCGDVYMLTVSTPNTQATPSMAVAQCATGKLIEMPTPQNPNHPAFVPELLTPIPMEAVVRYVRSGRFGMQKKYDGHRMALSYSMGEVIAYNRTGKRIPVPDGLAEDLAGVAWSNRADAVMMDGEYVRGHFVAFDLLVYDTDCRHMPYEERWSMLKGLVNGESRIRVAELYLEPEAMMLAIEDEKETNGEGVVFKRLDKPYMPGRQGTSVKLKFWATATVRIAKKQKSTTHHSFGTEVLKETRVEGVIKYVEWIYTGSVTCKGPLPEIGTYREVKYLYVAVGGHLYQPEDWGARTDVDDMDCSWTQLKSKQEKEKML